MTVRPFPGGHPRRVSTLVLVLVCVAASAVATPGGSPQSPPPVPPAATAVEPAEAQVQPAPVIRFDQAGLSLEEAVRLTLTHQPALARQRAAVARQEGVLQEETGLFDVTLAGRTSFDYLRQDLPVSQQRLTGAAATAGHNGLVNLQLAAPFRSGLSVSPFVELTYARTDFREFTDPARALAAAPGLFASRTGLTLGVPLGRGRGARATAASERSALVARDAERLALDHTTAEAALGTVAAYWDLRAAEESEAITARWVETQEKLTALTRELIGAGELPAVEIGRAQAAEARSRAQLNEARRATHQARVALALAMGVGASADAATLPRARDDFPAPPASPAVSGAPLEGFLAQAETQRRDLASSALRERAGETLAEGARLNLRLRLDAFATAFVAARDEGRAFSRWSSPSAEVSLLAERPIGNNVLRGQLAQREAEWNDARIAAFDVRRQIGLGVVEAASTLAETIERVRHADAAVGFARATVQSEVERFRAGEATLIDTVLTQQQQTDAELALVAARRDLAQIIARLRFETGSLVPADGTLDGSRLVTLPIASERRP